MPFYLYKNFFPTMNSTKSFLQTKLSCPPPTSSSSYSYLFVQPCNGRHLPFMDSSNLSHHPRKVDHGEPSKYSLERPQSFNLGPVNKDIVHEIQGDVAAERLKGPKSTPSTGINSRREMEPDDTQIQSHDTNLSLNAPQEKYEERVEFNFDYDQPKAHPPSHN